jgi:asparagine synthetase B (glutamine-hydrolysing)
MKPVVLNNQRIGFFIDMFVLAIQGKKSSALLIARDHFRIKPVSNTNLDGVYAFSF